MELDEHTAWALKHWNGKNQTIWYDTWIVVYENVTDTREMMWHPQRLGVIVFGAVLASWIAASNIVLAVTLCRRRKYEKIRPVNWLILNFLVAEFFTGTFVVPLNVKTEREGGWSMGPGLCRAWLLMQILLATLTAWSALVITIDRLVYVLNPHSYLNRMTPCRTGSLIFLSWLVSLATIIPPAWSMYQDKDFVFEEVCAMSMNRSYALGISFAAFFAPGVILLLGTIAILAVAFHARSRRCKQFGGHDAQALCNKKCASDAEAFITYLDSQSISNVASSTLAINLAIIALWAPFYVLNVMIPFCDGMCVDPNLWSLCVWLGYSSAGVCPVLWFIDREVREQYKDLIMCRRDVVYYDEDNDTPSNCGDTKTTSWHFEDTINIFKPYLFLKQEPAVF